MHWYHTAEVIELQTPSRNDGLDFETEAKYRKEGARFIMELGNKLGLRYLTMATGIVFFHRFYMFHSFKEFSRWVTGSTCLFLAGKVEETPKKCRDILKVAQQSLSDHQFKKFGENPREEVMICERILLQTIKFDLQMSHPYQYLIRYGKLLKGDKSKINELVQKAWIFINDSLSTTLCLVYKPQVVALAVLLMAFKLSNQNIRDLMAKPRVDWWKEFYPEASEKDLEEICKELMNMYEGKPPKRRFPNRHVDKVRASETKSNSPQPPDSPQIKRQKMGTPPVAPVSVAATTTYNTTTTTVTTTTDSTNTAITTLQEPVSTINESVITTTTTNAVHTSQTKHLENSLHAEQNVQAMLQAQAERHKNELKQLISEQTQPTPQALGQQQSYQQVHSSYQYTQVTPQKQHPVVNATSLQITQQNMSLQQQQQQQVAQTSQQNQQQPQQTQQHVVQQTQQVSQQQQQQQQQPAPAPILDHMSSFFNPSYTQFANQAMQPVTFPPFPAAPMPVATVQAASQNYVQQQHYTGLTQLQNPVVAPPNFPLFGTPPIIMQPQQPTVQQQQHQQQVNTTTNTVPVNHMYPTNIPWIQQPR